IIFFGLLGYTPFALGLLLALFIPTTILLKIEQGIITSTVITLNLYVLGSIQYEFLKEQILLILIGIGTGLVMNLYMPRLDNKLKKKQNELERNFQVILIEIAKYIELGNLDWSRNKLVKNKKIIDKEIKLE